MKPIARLIEENCVAGVRGEDYDLMARVSGSDRHQGEGR